MSYAAIGMGILLCPIRIALIDRVPPAEPVQVYPTYNPNRIPVDELARTRIIVPVRQAQQTRLRVSVVPELTPEACGVVPPS